MSPRSLNARLALSVGLLLILFFGVTAVALDYFFRDLSVRAISDRLEVQLQAMMAAVDEVDGVLAPVKEQLNPRLLAPNSGLYGEIVKQNNDVLWRAPSLLGNKLCQSMPLEPGQQSISNKVLADGTRVLRLTRAYSWEFDDRHQQLLQFCVAESEEPYFKQLNEFRWRLFGGFAVMGLILIVAMLWLLRTVLRPLRQVENEILMIESGARQQLSINYPRELAGAASNMNMLLKNERERMERYRNSLGNLAHSLKTPLAVIRNLLSSPSTDVVKIDEQVSVMDDIVRYQLRRASVAAGGAIGAINVPLSEVINPLVEAMQKVYADKRMDCTVEIDRDVSFNGDKNDLMEIVGNVLDNAFKYGRRKIRVSVKSMEKISSNKPWFELKIEDDGAGIPEPERESVMRRGKRLDEQQSGQGIGLSVVNELVELYGGTISIDTSPLGGVQVLIRFDGASPK